MNNIEQAALHIKNWGRLYEEEKEALSELEKEVIALVNSIISAQLARGVKDKKDIIKSVFASVDELSVNKGIDLKQMRALLTDLVRRGEIEKIVVDDESTDEAYDGLRDTYSINELLTSSDKAKLRRAINNTVNDRVSKRLQETEEVNQTSRGSQELPDDIKTEVLTNIDNIISMNQGQELPVLYSAIQAWIEGWLRSNEYSRSPILELIDTHLTSLGLNQDYGGTYNQGSDDMREEGVKYDRLQRRMYFGRAEQLID